MPGTLVIDSARHPLRSRGVLLNGWSLKDRVAAVTGAASGIRLACARLLAARGARVAFSGYRCGPWTRPRWADRP